MSVECQYSLMSKILRTLRKWFLHKTGSNRVLFLLSIWAELSFLQAQSVTA